LEKMSKRFVSTLSRIAFCTIKKGGIAISKKKRLRNTRARAIIMVVTMQGRYCHVRISFRSSGSIFSAV
jgi:hypothetical protein